MPNLFPENIQQQTVPEEAGTGPGYRPAAYFNGRDFVLDGAHRVVKATGADAWKQWCQKCLMTPKGSSIAYGSDYGIRTDGAFQCGDRKLAENILTREIREALQADPLRRLSSIQEISYDWHDNTSVTVTVTATGIAGDTASIQTTLGGDRNA